MIDRPAVAIEVLTLLAEPATTETLVLVLDHTHRGSVCLSVAGPVSPAAVVSLLAALAGSGQGVGALVVASTDVCPAWPSAEEELAWFEARERLDEIGVDLLDWFGLSGRRAVSLAEVSDSQPRWRSRWHR